MRIYLLDQKSIVKKILAGFVEFFLQVSDESRLTCWLSVLCTFDFD